MRHFASMLWDVIRAHPILFALLVVVIVLTLGGLVWSGLAFLFRLVRKVPGGGAVADAASGAVAKVAGATGSA